MFSIPVASYSRREGAGGLSVGAFIAVEHGG